MLAPKTPCAHSFDPGQKLGCGAYLATNCVGIASGKFDVAQAIACQMFSSSRRANWKGRVMPFLSLTASG